MKKDKVIIFDTTLRDGEQCPGASLNNKKKLEIAYQLESLGVNVIEAGFPISSPDDFQGVVQVAKHIKKSIVCALARSITTDIDSAYEAVKKAKHPRIHVFIATSKIHRKYKFKGKAKEEILETAVNAVKYARNLTGDIEFSPEDASRTEPDFLYKIVEEAIKAGATTINIPDTVGYSEPAEFGALIKGIMNNVPNIGKGIISIHCHNDLGLAVGNSLSAIANGARQVECTINGIGERAGNAALEEIVMAIQTRKDIFKGISSDIRTKELYKTSKLVSNLTGLYVQRNKAIIGQNAFSHESGIHQDGMLKHQSTYEIMKPEDVGFGGTNLVLGKHSGRHALKARFKKLGYVLDDKELDNAFKKFKSLADKKKEVFDVDLATIVEDELSTEKKETYKLFSFEANSGNKISPKAKVILIKDGKNITGVSKGDGPVDACCKAIDNITKIKGKLSDYRLSSVSRGKDALGEVTLRYTAKDRDVTGRGTSTDIIEASVKAYLDAVNRWIN
ncbi:MAG: 2-isopropylmalate synthase, partial [Candidatus Omnitrophica bacterium]|nr:2-isopropylmalate synthase [Candidatus Omnitrophota bacterium]